MEKNEIRNLMKAKRNLFFKNESFEAFSEIINQNILNIILSKYKALNIGLYFPIKNEINTKLLLDQFLIKNISLSLPKIINNKIEMLQIPKNTKNIMEVLEKSRVFDLLEPKAFCKKNNIDVMIIPGLAFNMKGFRVGYGKGFYDKYLKEHNKIYKIGICFDFQITNNIKPEIHDINVDLIVTESKIIDTKNNSMIFPPNSAI